MAHTTPSGSPWVISPSYVVPNGALNIYLELRRPCCRHMKCGPSYIQTPYQRPLTARLMLLLTSRRTSVRSSSAQGSPPRPRDRSGTRRPGVVLCREPHPRPPRSRWPLRHPSKILLPGRIQPHGVLKGVLKQGRIPSLIMWGGSVFDLVVALLSNTSGTVGGERA